MIVLTIEAFALLGCYAAQISMLKQSCGHGLFDALRWDQHPETSVTNYGTNLRRLKPKTSEGLNHAAAEA